MTHLLLLESDAQFRRALSVSLRARGYGVEEAGRGDEALNRVVQAAPDAVLLGGVRDMAPADLVRLLRQETAAPILLLCERDGQRERAAGLEAGADDFVTKPFPMGELIARLRAALAVRPAAHVDLTRWVETPSFVLDLAGRHAYAGGEEVSLTGPEWRLVELLVGSRGGLVNEARLLEALAPEQSGPGGLRRCLAGVRAKLEPDPSRPQYFLSEPGLGWRLVLPEPERVAEQTRV